jgi:hypothetical protein
LDWRWPSRWRWSRSPARAAAPGKPDPRPDEMEKDVQRFAQMVTEYRGTAHEILRAYKDKVRRSTPNTTRRSI